MDGDYQHSESNDYFIKTKPKDDSKSKKSVAKDTERLYQYFADKYFSVCAGILEQHFPNHMYLGSRIRHCPPPVALSSAEHADIISVNHFHPVLDIQLIPAEIDKPILVSRFHVGAMDRGVPGWGNLCVSDQRERARMWAACVVSGLTDPRIAGVHWDAYCDQSAAAQPGKGNQVGFVDITDQPYGQLTKMTRKLADSMYELRQQEQSDQMHTLETILESNK